MIILGVFCGCVANRLTCFAAVDCKIVFLSHQGLGQSHSTANHLAGVRSQFCRGGGRGGAVGAAHFGCFGNCFH